MSRAEQSRPPTELRHEIDRTRAELGETVHELAARMDVPSRAKAAYGRTRTRVRTRVRQSQRELMVAGGAAGALVVGVVLLMVWRRRRQ